MLTANYDYYKYTDKDNTVDNAYSFLKSNLTYQKKNSKWEFGLKGTNLLNTKSLNKDSTSDLYIATTAYFVQPRYIMATMKYEL